MFESFNGDFDIQKKHINEKGEFVITAGLSDNGILGKTDVKAKIFGENTITIDMFGYAFYRPFKYKMVTHARVFSLYPKFKITKNHGLFIANSFHFFKYKFGYENMCSWNKIKHENIKLPINLKSEIDFEFMENFIAELEAERIAELEAYLLVTNLKDYKLTTDEQNALKEFENLEWKEFKIGDLFNRLSTKKLPYKAKDLPNIPTDRYILPCLTSSFQNQGLNYYAPKENATVLKNVISIPSNSDIYRAYFQSREFTVLSDAYGIDWIDKNFVLLSQQYLFIVTCINKVTDLPKYSYKNKLGGWNVVKNKFISLPTKNGEIDFKFMENFIIAVQKLVIKYVVLYADEKIKATKEVIEKSDF